MYKFIMSEIQSMDERYQVVIDDIYSTPCLEGNDDRMTGAYLLACAIKEIMTHKDSEFIGNGYLYEKISKACKRLNIKIED